MRRLTLCLLACLPAFAAAQQSYPIQVQYDRARSAPLPVSFSIQAPAGAHVTWDFGEGLMVEGASVKQTFWAPGTYQVRVSVKDGPRNATANFTVQAPDGGPERAQLTLLHFGNSVAFSAEGSRVYAPLDPRWQLNGRTVGTSTVHLNDGVHILRLELPGRTGTVTREVRFRTGQVAGSAAFDLEVLRLTNDARARGWDCTLLRYGSAGRPPLARNAQLDLAARAQSSSMALHNYFDHVSPVDGSSAGVRARAAGYAWMGVAENIAAGQKTPQEVVDAWLRSPGHCRNVMGEFQEIGLSFVERPAGELRTYWTQVFGRR